MENLDQSPPLLWVNGKLREPDTPVFFATDRGATLGDGVFDTALCLRGVTINANAHLLRLKQSIAAFGYRCCLEHLDQAYRVAQNVPGPAILRVSITRGPGSRGLAYDPNQNAQILTQLLPMPSGMQFPEMVLDVASFPRNDQSPVSRHKTAGYLDAIIAMRKAQSHNADDALFLNSAGHVACTTMANVFAISGKELVTPPLSDGVLNGITRARVLDMAGKLGLVARETSFSVDQMQQADEVFTTNSLRLVMPILNFGGRALLYRRTIARALCDEIEAQSGHVLPRPDWDQAEI